MIIIDKALEKLEKENKPIRVGLVGAGFAGRGFALQMLTCNIGMRLVAISNRTLSEAKRAYKEVGETDIVEVNEDLDKVIKSGTKAITTNPNLLCDSKLIDVIVEATGEIEFGAQVIMRAIQNKKHVVLINAELDSTLGPILKFYADKNGVVYTQADGDQPAVLMNLYRYVKSIGFKPVLAGNIKSLIDHYRTPDTQEKFARDHFQKTKMITSFADGTKISMEMATVANATGFKVGKRGMYGPSCKHVDEAYKLFPLQKMLNTGLIDYILGAEPSFGVFILGYTDNLSLQRYMKVYKMGDGPLYTFYVPYHLSPLEAPLSIARSFLFQDAALAPKAGLVCEVITVAKKDLKKGDILDGIGGFCVYGVIDNVESAQKENLLPIGLSEGCELLKDIPKDKTISYQDIKLPPNRLSDKLKVEQNKLFG